jgi:ribosomal protein S18 acetylase RimI-like enzyme
MSDAAESIAVRPALPADVTAVTGLVEAAYQGYIPRIGKRPAPMDADYAGLIDAGLVWVAESAEAILGVLVLVVHSDHLLLENIAVAPGSQDRGVGKLLMQAAERHARDAGVAEIRLYTHQAMTENHAYYERRGFTETHRGVDDGFARVFYTKLI